MQEEGVLQIKDDHNCINDENCICNYILIFYCKHDSDYWHDSGQ